MLDRLATVTPLQWGLAALVVLLFFAFSARCILDAWNRDFGSSGEKAAWIQVIIFIPILGALAYLLIGKNRGAQS